ncbi:5-oxoprolinase [Geodia barretti]|nr:5-oxoprolinase [Geodia barretti]
MLFFRSGMFVVGPESAGANPGPACYGRGGPITVTDANLILGRLLPKYFPRVFGETDDEPLQTSAAMTGFKALTHEINHFMMGASPSFKEMTVQEVAMGFIEVANEAMCRPIRAMTQGKGHDIFQHILACFGGAGGQHACAVARALGITKIYIHRYSGILSAYGLALADVVQEMQEPCAKVYCEENMQYFDEKIQELIHKCVQRLKKQGFQQ